MRRFHEITLEELGKQSALDVEIEFDFFRGEKMVKYFADGSGYPGSPPEADGVRVRVQKWYVGDETRKRGFSPVWKALDLIALGILDQKWDDQYRDDCISEAVERENER